MTTDARRIRVWPDGTWMDQDEHEDAMDSWRGDDHFPLAVPAHMTDEDIDEAALRAALGGLRTNLAHGISRQPEDDVK